MNGLVHLERIMFIGLHVDCHVEVAPQAKYMVRVDAFNVLQQKSSSAYCLLHVTVQQTSLQTLNL